MNCLQVTWLSVVGIAWPLWSWALVVVGELIHCLHVGMVAGGRLHLGMSMAR